MAAWVRGNTLQAPRKRKLFSRAKPIPLLRRAQGTPCNFFAFRGPAPPSVALRPPERPTYGRGIHCMATMATTGAEGGQLHALFTEGPAPFRGDIP
jgi:hypothetical protein